MTPVLIGYFPKKATEAPPDWLAGTAAPVVEICSVSKCIAPAPPDWIDHWLHNRWSCFDSPELARKTISTDLSEFDVYAWLLYPVRFENGSRLPLRVVAPDVHSLPAHTQLLGYDAVSSSKSRLDFDQGSPVPDYFGFECSPLSCNQMARSIPCNRYCLIDG